jgi:competence ComEA-like helix-hairpin-helix protein
LQQTLSHKFFKITDTYNKISLNLVLKPYRMNWKQFAADYLIFSRKERIGASILIIAIFGIWLIPEILPKGKKSQTFADTSHITQTKKIQTEKENAVQVTDQPEDENINRFVYEKSVNENPVITKRELFYFDPNVLSFNGWKKLGIRDKTIHVIQNYLNKGDHFYKPVDLQKIYGLSTNEYSRLEPYIKIDSKDNKNADKNNGNSSELKNISKKYTTIDINAADTTAFSSLPGIGNKLAFKIVNFREKLGGFYSADQVVETYGLPDSTFKKIRPFLSVGNVSVKKLNINSATKDEMKLHPYIKWNLASAIAEYRNQHGNYSSLEDLKKISMITEEVFGKIKFYLTTQ